MNVNSTVSVVVEGGGEGVVAHVGLHALGAFADRLNIGDCLSEVIPWAGERAPDHDRGKVLVQAMLMFACHGGGEACTDIEHLRSQESLFGSVPSDSTLYRTFRYLDDQVRATFGDVRSEVWSRSSATTGSGEVVLDIDSSLHEIHSENKEGTGAIGDALVRWFQLICMPGRFSTAEPKTMRWSIWHTPARIVRHARQNIVRILDGWPTTNEILAAYQRIELIT